LAHVQVSLLEDQKTSMVYAIVDFLARKPSDLGPVRASLIRKGMIYSPAHGQIAFTVPLFDEFLRRAIPGFQKG